MRISRMSILPVISALLSAALWTGACRSADNLPGWPQFHGPRRDNRSTETGLLKKWPQGGPTLLWTAKGLGEGFATVSIADGIYTCGNIDGNRLYHESPLGNVVCLDAKTGKKIWGLNILEEFGGKKISWALAESLLVDGDRVICSPGGPQTAVVALDKNTGQTVWKSPSAGDSAGYASPALVEYQGLRMILTLTAKALIGVNADDGDMLFAYDVKAE